MANCPPKTFDTQFEQVKVCKSKTEDANQFQKAISEEGLKFKSTVKRNYLQDILAGKSGGANICQTLIVFVTSENDQSNSGQKTK